MESRPNWKKGQIVKFINKEWEHYCGKLAKVVRTDHKYVYIIFLDENLAESLGWDEECGGGFYSDSIEPSSKLDRILE